MSPTRRGILAAGLWLIDVTKHIDHYPAPSRLARVQQVVFSNGGGPFNLLVDLARLGAPFPLHAAGRIGEDPPGDWILERCRNHGIMTERLGRMPGRPTACTDVMTETGSGRRTFFYLAGANEAFGAGDLDLSSSDARILYLGYPGLLPGLDQAKGGRSGLEELLAAARATGHTTAVDLVSAEGPHWDSVRAALPLIDLLFVNEWEAARLLEGEVPAEEQVGADDLIRMARALLERGIGEAVIAHAAAGAVCVTRQGAVLTLGAVDVPPAEIRGACGAGDALAAGFLFGRHEALGWAECLELGIAAAATCLHHLTSSDGVRPWRECLDYGRLRGHRRFQ